MSKKLNFTVIVCAYNCAGGIRDTLSSLTNQSYPKDSYEIVVIDDCSTDDTAKVVRRFKTVRLVNHPINKGVGAARNTGLKHAKGKWVAFIDDDCIADKQWLHELEKELKRPGTIGAGGLISPKSTAHILQRYLYRSGYGRPASVTAGAAKNPLGRLIAYAKDKFKHASGTTEPGEAYEVYGANSAFSKRKLKSVKGFNVDLRSAEDSDICRRLQDQYPEESIRFNPSAGVRHDYTNSYAAYFSKLFRRQSDTWDYYAQQKKTPPFYPFPVAILLACIASAFASKWGPLYVALIAPLIFYGWWTFYAIRYTKPELLAYPFIQFTEESVRLAGLLKAGATTRVADSRKAIAHPPARKKTATTAIPKIRFGNSITLPTNTLLTILGMWTLLFVLAEASNLPWRGIIAGPFIFVVPGLLLTLALKVKASVVRTASYVISSSIALLILTGLAANTIVLLSNNKIQFNPALPALMEGVASIILAYVAFKRLPKGNALTVPIVPARGTRYALLTLLLPIGGVIASLYLNNTGNNIISLWLIGILVMIATGMVLLYKHLTATITALLLFSLGLAFMVLGSMRGDFIPGVDIAHEYYVYQLVVHTGHWAPSLMKDAYNACLSITLLPFSLSKLLNINNMAMLRILFPAMYALTPVIVYALVRLVSKHVIALLAALFFISQPSFIEWASIPLRQMMGILFFSGMLLVIFDKHLPKLARNLLFLLLGTAMILSHYSTSYLSIGLLVIAYVLQLLYHLWHYKQLPWKIRGFKPIVSLPMLVTLSAVAFIWFVPVTHASNNITREFKIAWSEIERGRYNLFNPLSAKGHANKTSFVDQFTLSPQSSSLESEWNGYLQQTSEKYAGLHIIPLQGKTAATPITPQTTKPLPHKASPIIVSGVSTVNQGIRKVVRLLLLVGLVVIIWRLVRYKKASVFDLYALTAAIILALVILVPRASLVYDVGRTSQQLLVLLALPAISGGLLLAGLIPGIKKFRSTQYYLVGAAIVLLMLMVSGLPEQLTGGHAPTMLLNNTGNQYDQLYIHKSEISAANWLATNKNGRNYISAGYFGGNRLWISGIRRPTTYDDILPWTIDKHAYLFESYGETTSGLATTYYNGQYIRYTYPTKLITESKNTIYSNGQTEIYK